MNKVKSVKAAVIVSQVIISLWLFLTLLLYLLQRQVQIFFMGSYFNTLNYAPIFIDAHVFQFLAFALTTAVNCFILNKKKSFRFSPLIISSLVLGLTVILSDISLVTQQIKIARLFGSDQLAAFGNLTAVDSWLSCLLYSGIITTIAAAAVYAYSKGINRENTVQ